MYQFLQVNNLAGDKEMKRVATLVLRKKVDLTQSDVDLNQWQTFSLDLSDLVNKEPGAIYRVLLSFNKSYSLFPCCVHSDENADDR